jgi:transcriptional regulator with XRE-family HTH domain
MQKNSREPDVGRRMAARRLQRGLSQSAVARRARVDPSYLSRIETGKVHPTVRTAMRIAEALRTDLQELLQPSPPDRKDTPCPVSPSGHCLLDLIHTGSGSRQGAYPETVSPQQLRLLRRLTELVQHGSPKLLTALEVLLGQLLERKA